MNNLKTALLMSSLFVIGFLGGFFIHQSLTIKKVEAINHSLREEGFARMAFRGIDSDSAQIEQVRPIIRKYGRRMAKVHLEAIQHRKTLVDSMLLELEPLLTEEQHIELKKSIRRFRQGPPPPHRRKGKYRHLKE